VHAWTQRRLPCAPPQVRNLRSCIKVAMDFVSPESLGQCEHMAQALRRMPHDMAEQPQDRPYQDKLQV
jgi:lysine-specific demethylase 3